MTLKESAYFFDCLLSPDLNILPEVTIMLLLSQTFDLIGDFFIGMMFALSCLKM
jgi:hypothetical protein